MKKLAASFFVLAALASGSLYAQSCPGAVSAGIKDDGGTSITPTITRVAYFQSDATGPGVIFGEEKFENTKFMGFHVTEVTTASVSDVTVSSSGISFPARCQTYSVQMTLVHDGKEMVLGFYNLSNDKNIQVGDITFAEGIYYVDMEAGNTAIPVAPGKYKMKAPQVMSFGHTKNIQGIH